MSDPEALARENEYIRTWGKIPAEGDFLGLWLMNVLHGKRQPYLMDAAGREVENTRGIGVFQVGVRSNSMPEPFTMGGGCCYEIKLHWDQWVRCTITCEHGSYEGVSDFFNVTEAIVRAAVAFNQEDHPENTGGEEKE